MSRLWLDLHPSQYIKQLQMNWKSKCETPNLEISRTKYRGSNSRHCPGKDILVITPKAWETNIWLLRSCPTTVESCVQWRNKWWRENTVNWMGGRKSSQTVHGQGISTQTMRESGCYLVKREGGPGGNFSKSSKCKLASMYIKMVNSRNHWGNADTTSPQLERILLK